VILLNGSGRVAEAEGAAVVVISDECLYSPPVSEGALPSITWAIVKRLAGTLGLTTVERPIERSLLSTADAVFLAGTLCELVPLKAIDDIYFESSSNSVYGSIASKFDDLRCGLESDQDIELITSTQLDEMP
jgi:branched-chain amino acid aminotransferase